MILLFAAIAKIRSVEGQADLLRDNEQLQWSAMCFHYNFCASLIFSTENSLKSTLRALESRFILFTLEIELACAWAIVSPCR